MTSPTPIRVIIVDDHPVVRSGIQFSMQTVSDIVLVGSAQNGEDALLLCAQVRPDVVLMDVKMEKSNGLSATKAIRDLFPEIQVIILTSFPKREWVAEALEAGVTSFLLKNIDFPDLAEAIRMAYRGEGVLSPEAIQALSIRAAPQEPQYDLTSRQLEILALLAAGLSNRAIAEKLSISLSTVRFHISNILSKMGVANRAEAAARAVEDGLI